MPDINFTRSLWIQYLNWISHDTYLRTAAVPITRIPLYASGTLVLLYIYVINITPAFSVHRLRTLCVLGCDFMRPFDQRRNVRAQKCLLKCRWHSNAPYYTALCFAGELNRASSSICTNKGTRSNILDFAEDAKIRKSSTAFKRRNFKRINQYVI